MAKGKSRIRPWLYALLAVLGLALLAVLLAWVFRRPIAAELTKRFRTSVALTQSLLEFSLSNSIFNSKY